jgi:hypothetical protein
MKIEQTQCSETLAIKHLTPENNPKGDTRHSEHSKSLKSRIIHLYGEETFDLVTTIKITRLRWAGHIVQMQDNLPCKKITLDKPEGRRRVGRPNLRWMDGVMRDAEMLGIGTGELRKAMGRDVWRRILESAKTLCGL